MWHLPADIDAPLQQLLEELALAHRVLAANGHSSGTLGHMSIRDPDGRGFWLKRMGIGLNEVRGSADFILLDFSGAQLAGTGRRHSEWPIHSEIYLARPDVHVVCHTHPFHVATFSAITNAELQPLTHEGNYLYARLAYYKKMQGLIVTKALGEDLAATLGAGNVILMKNHGVTVVGARISVVGLGALAVESACRAQLMLAATPYEFSGPEVEDLTEGGVSRVVLPLERVTELWDFYAREAERRASAI